MRKAANQKGRQDKPSPGGDNSFGLGWRLVLGVVLAIMLVGGIGGWAASAQLSGAIISSGTVEVDQKLKSIQHRDGGIVSAIHVREGDHVTEGQVLISLDDAQTKAELAIVRNQVVELATRRARLLAERDGLSEIEYAGTPLGPEAEVVRKGEQRLFNGNSAHRESQKQQLALSIEQIGEEVHGLEAQKLAKATELSLVHAEHAKIKGLAERGLIEGSRVYAMERDLTRLQGEEGEIAAAIARALARTSELRLQIIAIDENARTEAQRELSAVETRLTEMHERSMAIEDRLSRADIKAPIAGTINELNVHTIDGVVTHAEVLATIVPDGAHLKIAVRLAPHVIDQVQVGRTARLRFTAFNQRTTPELIGSVAHIAAATARDRVSGEVYYAGEIKVDEDEMGKLGGAMLMPGMPVEIFISTDERTTLSYLVRPITDQLGKAFRER
jgi:HlyD family type I secretion membrane fusion protein